MARSSKKSSTRKKLRRQNAHAKSSNLSPEYEISKPTKVLSGEFAEHRSNGEFVTQITKEKRTEFLSELYTHSNVSQACEKIGVSRRSMYAIYDREPEFATAWDSAIKIGVRCLEEEAKRRAMGYEEKVYKNGTYVGKVKKYSDLLLLALLNAHWPEKYRRTNGEQPSPVSPDDQKRLLEARDVLKRLSTDELSTIATVMEKATTRAVAQAVSPNGKRTLQ